jgi:O-acetylhomoserine (thiol)-lyase
MKKHSENALEVAKFLQGHSKISWVNYAGLDDSEYKNLAKKYCPDGTGAVFTFGVKGGFDAGVKLVNEVSLFSHLANIGDAKSLIIHPASTTHSQLTDEQLIAAGAGKDVIRVSIGIEDSSDIIDDLNQALEKI